MNEESSGASVGPVPRGNSLASPQPIFELSTSPHFTAWLGARKPRLRHLPDGQGILHRTPGVGPALDLRAHARTSSDDANTVLAAYKKSMSAKGWKEDMAMDFGEQKSFVYKKNDRTVTLVVETDEDEGQTVINLSVQGAEEGRPH